MIAGLATAPKEMLEFLSRSPIENLMLLSFARLPKKRFYADLNALDSGVMAVAGKESKVTSAVAFSKGEPDFQMRLVRHLSPGPYMWTIPSEPLYQALTETVRFSPVDLYVAYSRASGGPLPSGTARLLTADDIPVLVDERPFSANVIAMDAGARVFGVIEGGQWVADAWIVPMHGQYWTVADLQVKPDHRRHGYGKMVVGACVNYLLETGKVPVFETEEENTAARRLAEGLGFTFEVKRVLGEGILSRTRNGLALAR